MLALLVALLSCTVSARAAGEASDVVVDVVDAAGGAPVALARVILQGESAVIGYTDADGHARFESVATGSYRASVAKRGYVVARSPLFDVRASRTSTVQVRLQRPGALKQIGSVSVVSSPARASREVGQDDALRYLDGSLRDALGDLPGVTSSGDGLQIDGNDPSQTGTSVDGVSIPGVGGSFGDRGINADLFGGASVSSGAHDGALGGNVGFRTLQPTRFAQQQATLQYGSDNSSSALVLARGSVRNLGYVVEHAVRGRTSPFTGLDFIDQTGTAYRHDGDRVTSGDLVKLRWSPSIAQTLTLTATSTGAQSALVCAQRVALYPCGFGPNAFGSTRGSLVTLSENATIGGTSVALSGFANASRDTSDEAQRRLAGVAAPQSDDLRANARGLSLIAQLPAGERHDVSLTAQTYGLSFDGRATTLAGSFPIGQLTAYHAAALVDRFHPSERLTVTARGGVNGGNGGNAFAAGLGVRWQPVRSVAYDVSASAGDLGAGVVLSSAVFPDPRSLTFDCANALAYGEIPSTNAARQRSSSLRASVERSGRHGRVALTAWSAHLAGAPVFTAVDGAALGLPPGYLQAVGAVAASPFVCGSNALGALAFTSLQPADQINRGATLAGTLEIGKALLAGYATVQSRFVTGATPATEALTPVGMQVPGAPLHRAGLVASAKLGRAVDLLANVSYTAANNPNRLPAYTLLNAGLAFPLREGSLALVGTNVTNRFAGPFVPAASTVALTRAGLPPLMLAATSLGPRAVALTYTVRVGRLGATGSGAAREDASSAENADEHRLVIRATRMHDGAQPDALQIDPDNDACTPAAARIAQPAMDAIGRIAQAAERAKSGGRYPATFDGAHTVVSGITLEYTPYDNGARFSVTAAAQQLAGVAFLNCARLSIAGTEERDKFHLYFPPSQQKGEFFIAYGPSVGLYFVPPQEIKGTTSRVRLSPDPEPAVPPADPFAERPAPACPVSAKPVADAVVAAMRAARDAQRAGTAIPSADVAEIVAHGAASKSWFEIKPRDMFSETAVIQCLHVAGVSPAHLAAAGIDDTRRHGIGFTDRFGFYVIAEPDESAPPT